MRDKRGAASLDVFAAMMVGIGILLFAFYSIAYSNKTLLPSDNFMLKMGGALLLFGIAILVFRCPAWMKDNMIENDKLNDIAKCINADKVYGSTYINFIGVYNGIKYKSDL